MKEFDEIILKRKLDAAKNDLEYWKSLSDTIGQPKRDNPNCQLFFSCQLMGYCNSEELGNCVFYLCRTRPSKRAWKRHHKKYHPKDDLLYVRCNECKRIQDEETRFMESCISALENKQNPISPLAFSPSDKKIDFTGIEYASVLLNLPIASHQKQMLLANYHAPNRTLTATMMAKAMGYDNFNAANLHYGMLGGLVGEKLGWNPLPEFKVNVLVDFKKEDNWLWIMKPAVAEAIRLLGWNEDASTTPEEVDEPIYEGAVRRVSVNAYERSGVARAECLRHYGCKCTVCGAKLSDAYGEVAHGYIHVHHLRQLAEINSEYRVDPIADLRPICPTCHSIIHLKKPPYTIEEVQKMIESQRFG
jgi:5-methylcytosine-specific restriction protein A